MHTVVCTYRKRENDTFYILQVCAGAEVQSALHRHTARARGRVSARAIFVFVFFSNECIRCKHPAYGVPPCTPLMQPRARSHMPTRMGPHSETAPAGACRNMKHSRILSTRAVLRAHTSRRPRTPLEMPQAFVAHIRSSQVPSTGGVK